MMTERNLVILHKVPGARCVFQCKDDTRSRKIEFYIRDSKDEIVHKSFQWLRNEERKAKNVQRILKSIPKTPIQVDIGNAIKRGIYRAELREHIKLRKVAMNCIERYVSSHIENAYRERGASVIILNENGVYRLVTRIEFVKIYSLLRNYKLSKIEPLKLSLSITK